MGRPALAIGGLVLIAAGGAVAFGWWWPSSASENSQVPTIVRSVEFDVTSGDVEIRTGDVTETSVREKFHSRGSEHGHTYRVDGGKLVLDGCGDDCTVDYEIVVPRGATVHGRSTSGGIDLTGAADADVQTTSGSVDVRDGAGPVRARSSSGSVTVDLASPQDVTAEATSGDIELRVPADHYRVLTDVHSGHTDVQVPNETASAHTLDLRATSGDIEVRQR